MNIEKVFKGKIVYVFIHDILTQTLLETDGSVEFSSGGEAWEKTRSNVNVIMRNLNDTVFNYVDIEF